MTWCWSASTTTSSSRPHLFEGRLPAKYAGPGAAVRHPRRRHQRLGLRGRRDRQRRPQRRRRPPAGGVRHGADLLRRAAARLLRHRRAGQGHGRQRRARLAVLPVVPAVLRPAVRPHRGQGRRAGDGPGLQRLAHRRVVRHPSRAGSSPARCRRSGTPRCWPTRCAARPRKGAHAVTFSENPSKLGWPSFHTDHWDPFWQACSDEGVVVCMHIGSSSQLVITSPDAPIDVPDHAARR